MKLFLVTITEKNGDQRTVVLPPTTVFAKSTIEAAQGAAYALSQLASPIVFNPSTMTTRAIQFQRTDGGLDN